MNPTDGSCDDHSDHAAGPNPDACERLAAELAGLRPVRSGPDLRARIAAELGCPWTKPSMAFVHLIDRRKRRGFPGSMACASRSAELFPRTDSETGSGLAPVTPRRRLAAFGERLAWAAGGAVAASLAFVLAGAGAGVRDRLPGDAIAGDGPVAPVAARAVQIREEPVSWTDEGIRFIDDHTPARVVRRKVIERRMAGDGSAEVCVPREDFIFLPVALR